MVSTCHSLVVGVVGLYIFFFDEAAIADPLWGDTSLGKVNIAIASGYLVSEGWCAGVHWEFPPACRTFQPFCESAVVL